MLSLFYKKYETKIPKEIVITIFKPNKNDQVILAKSKIGQFKLKWFCLNKNNKYNLDNNTITKYIIWTMNNQTPNDFWTFKKENKHFMFDKKKNKINDIIYTTNLLNSDNNEKLVNKKINIDKKNILFRLKQEKKKKIYVNTDIRTKVENIYMGFMISLQNWNEKILNKVNSEVFNINDKNIDVTESKLLNKQIKNILKGISQGFSTNLELKGIGYQAKLENIQNVWKKNFLKINTLGQIESNIFLFKEYVKDIIKVGDVNDEKALYIKEELTKKKINNQNEKYLYQGKKIKEKNFLKLTLGTSHNILYPLHKHQINTKISVSQNNFVTLSLFSISNNILNQVAAEIYSLRKPEPYNGKGIRYNKEKFFPKEIKKKN